MSPYNRNRIRVHSKFLVTGEKMIVNIGSFRLINTERVITVDDFDLISIKREEGLFLSLNVNLFDKQNQLMAIINERPRDIALDIQITNEEIFITGTLYYLGFQIIIGITIENGRIGINGHTH